MSHGPLGFTVVDFTVNLSDGSYHDVDSSEMAFKIAAINAFRNGMKDAKPVLLEPISEVQVDVPEEFTGGVMGDLSSRRGKILGMEPGPKSQRIRAAVPRGELYRYSTTLRTLTQGRARFAQTFSHYEEVPREYVDKLVEELKKDGKIARGWMGMGLQELDADLASALKPRRLTVEGDFRVRGGISSVVTATYEAPVKGRGRSR
jgi:translation elongation factor EF-G